MFRRQMHCIGLVALIVGTNGYGQAVKPNEEPAVSADELPRTAPLSPEHSKGCLQVLPGFSVELVAAEPLVVDPVAFTFDARGRLFVAEMIDYSEQDMEALGRIALLEDLDGDGRMDKRSTFVDKLSWPTAVHPWRDGVVVIAPPKMTWYRDTDDDGTHDVVEEWYTGFGRENVQGMANSLRWSVDGYLVGVTSTTGTELKSLIASGGDRSLRGRDFRIDPFTKSLAPLSGGSQNGMAMNRWGDRFVTSNSDHLQQILDLEDWLQQHSIGSLPVTTRRSIAVDGPQAEVFRASPIEPWRIVRTRMRVSGVVPGAIEGGGRAAGYFTGASGTWVMDAEAGFGVPGFDTAFACDSGSNLVHRKKLERNGLFWKADRIDPNTELLRSTEIWFRPVQLGDGPDGALYIADMYREVIEHPKAIPPSIKQHLDLTSGNDRGRIWRVKRIDAEVATSSDLYRADDEALVATLSDPIAWRRRTASQLLIERNARGVGPSLKRLLVGSTKAEATVLALNLLRRLETLDLADLKQAAEHPAPEVKRHVLDIVRTLPEYRGVFDDLKTLEAFFSQTDDARVCLSLAMAAADLPNERRSEILSRLAGVVMTQHTAESTLLSIVVAAAGEDSVRLVGSPELAGSEAEQTRQKLLRLLLPHWAQQLSRNEAKATEELRASLSQLFKREVERGDVGIFPWIAALQGLRTVDQQNRLLAVAGDHERRALTSAVEVKLEDNSGSEQSRASVASWLRLASTETRSRWLDRFVGPSSSESSSIGIIEACMFVEPKKTSEELIRRFNELEPKSRERFVAKMIEYPESTMVLAENLERKSITANQLSPTVRQSLEKHPNAALRKRFASLLAAAKPTSEAVQKVIDAYTPVAEAADLSDASLLERGKLVFEKNCALCHRVDNLGSDVGPPLKSLHEKSPGQLLVSMLDPNREVDPRFQAWVVLLDDGRVVTGVIREESANQVVIAEANGKLTTIEREEIEQLKASGVSLMPTGLDKQLSAEAAAELIAWLRTRR